MKINFEIIIGDLKSRIKSFNFFVFVRNNSLIFTTLIFVLVLICSLVVWFQCVYAPKPSQSVIDRVDSAMKSYQNKSERIEKMIEAIKLRQKDLENEEKVQDDRIYFGSGLTENLPVSKNKIGDKNEIVQ